MKTTQFEVTIQEPCLQNWDEMESQNQDKFCVSCNKCVIDFSNYSNAEIISTLANSKTEICGRLSQNQLNQLNYYLIAVPSNRNWMKYLGVLAIGASIFIQDVNAAVPVKYPNSISLSDVKPNLKDEKPSLNRVFYGYVFFGDNKPAAGLKLQIKNTNYTAVTDKNGRYEFKLDDNFDRKSNVVIIKESDYVTELKLNFNTSKQQNYYPAKMQSMILGRMMYVPKKS
ncbi:hypothetical protein [Pedobacter jejuensis]|uniref:Uncharacterized protein n=1 Tax=Pedobacter jejuensis TaxID=1268550 RepID=A0A3N0BWM0_9SPHI|nr:hypothetical protein [Pedobacter jejuensis]RNL54028.1 hypothetical protein D7004_07980 [Pedobacter jejuensis]